MGGCVIDLNQIEMGGKRFGHEFEKRLETNRIEMRELIEKTVSSFRFHDAIQVKGLSLPLHRLNRFYAWSRNHSP